MSAILTSRKAITPPSTKYTVSATRLKTLIKESNLIEGISDPKEIDQSLRAWDILQDEHQLSHGLICHIQKIITLHQHLRPDQRGYYRSMSKVNVRVGQHVPPPFFLIDTLMDNWLLDYNTRSPWDAHCRFEYIHPFVDGNGRTGRMLMWWQELHAGDKPTLIKAKDRFAYYARLQEAHNGQ